MYSRSETQNVNLVQDNLSCICMYILIKFHMCTVSADCGACCGDGMAWFVA